MIPPITDDKGRELRPIVTYHDDRGGVEAVAYQLNGSGPAIRVTASEWAELVAKHARKAEEDDGA